MGNGRGRVPTQRHESGVVDGKLSGKTQDQIQADGEDDVDPDQHKNLCVIRIHVRNDQLTESDQHDQIHSQPSQRTRDTV